MYRENTTIEGAIKALSDFSIITSSIYDNMFDIQDWNKVFGDIVKICSSFNNNCLTDNLLKCLKDSTSLMNNKYNIESLNEIIERSFLTFNKESSNIFSKSKDKWLDNFKILTDKLVSTNSFVSIEFVDYLPNIQLEDLIGVLKDSLNNIQGKGEKIDQNTIIEEITEYIKDFSEDDNKENGITLNKEKKNVTVKEVREWISFVLGFLSFFITMVTTIYTITEKKEIHTSVININNYYIYEIGYDCDYLNDLNCKIVCQDIKVRNKPDCNSKVSGNLYMGQVVYVKDKYKKWNNIQWHDSDGNIKEGWIQNYKLVSFKNRK